ncbi:MAG: hypothetical protein BWX55_00919 [Deltaproteobacteria bacterium ADurb.Bin022]|nr:MAG: hypothetical protein BWX55_00919 [Deltaproteobacteria bacterium ADurb.Bin022]
MNVNINFSIEILGQTEFVGTRPDVAQRRLHGFLHDIAKFAGHNHFSVSFHDGGFDRQKFSADLRPGQTDRQPYFILFFYFTVMEFGHTQILTDRFGPDDHPSFFIVIDDFLGYFAADRSDFPIKIPDAGFACIFANDFQQGAVCKFNILHHQAVGFHLLGNQIFFRDLQFFRFRVSGNADHFHSVLKRRRNRLQNIRRRNKHDFRQVVIQIQIVVVERKVLLRIEHLQKRSRRIASEIGAEFIHLIQTKDRIIGTGFFQKLDDFSGHRSDVGPAVSSDLGLIVNPTQGNTDKFSVRRPGHRFGNGCFSHTRRTDKT